MFSINLRAAYIEDICSWHDFSGSLEEDIVMGSNPDSSNLDSSRRYESESEIVCDFDQLDENLTDLHEDEEQVKMDELNAQVRELSRKILKKIY